MCCYLHYSSFAGGFRVFFWIFNWIIFYNACLRTSEKWYDLAFALPGGAKESYLTAKLPLVAQILAAIEPLWGEP
jgi:hypothetical protein